MTLSTRDALDRLANAIEFFDVLDCFLTKRRYRRKSARVVLDNKLLIFWLSSEVDVRKELLNCYRFLRGVGLYYEVNPDLIASNYVIHVNVTGLHSNHQQLYDNWLSDTLAYYERTIPEFYCGIYPEKGYLLKGEKHGKSEVTFYPKAYGAWLWRKGLHENRIRNSNIYVSTKDSTLYEAFSRHFTWKRRGRLDRNAHDERWFFIHCEAPHRPLLVMFIRRGYEESVIVSDPLASLEGWSLANNLRQCDIYGGCQFYYNQEPYFDDGYPGVAGAILFVLDKLLDLADVHNLSILPQPNCVQMYHTPSQWLEMAPNVSVLNRYNPPNAIYQVAEQEIAELRRRLFSRSERNLEAAKLLVNHWALVADTVQYINHMPYFIQHLSAETIFRTGSKLSFASWENTCKDADERFEYLLSKRESQQNEREENNSEEDSWFSNVLHFIWQSFSYCRRKVYIPEEDDDEMDMEYDSDESEYNYQGNHRPYS